MSMVFAGVCSHGPGITARSERAEPASRARIAAAYARLGEALRASAPDALIVISAEHFANFFMSNMPAFAIGMADYYPGPIEDPEWLRIPRRNVPGDAGLARRIVERVLEDVDVSFCEEWRFDHGIMVPLHLLTPGYDIPVIPVNINCQAAPLPPLARAHALGRALRAACDAVPERIAVIATGGISHWPCTPDSGTINEDWDRAFLGHWSRNDTPRLLAYTDEETYRDGGQGGFEIRTYIALAAAAAGRGELWCYEPVPIYACGCCVGHMAVAATR